MTKIKCQKCGFEWEPYLAHPRACPRCKSYDYLTPRKRNKYAIKKLELGAIDINEQLPLQ